MRKSLALLALLPCLSIACRPESTGNLESPRTGDLSHPLAEREMADAELIEECGEPIDSEFGGFMRRMPYLQQLGTKSSKILWTSLITGTPYVEVTTPQGVLVAQVEAKREGSTGDPSVAAWGVDIEGLTDDTVYCYSVFEASGVPLLERVGFRTAPTFESDKPAKFLVIGDSGEGSADQFALVEQMPTVPIDFMLHVGDMAYESGTFPEFEKNFFEVYEDLMKNFAVFPVPGNHEYVTDDAGPYRAVFDLPNNERWYSFDWGPVHFVALDTEQIGATQTKWLEEDLEANDKPWVVAYMHKPPYSSGSHGSEMPARDTFSPIFRKHNVPLVITGHDHHYERVRPQNGVHYFVSGGGGAGTYPVKESEFSAFAQEVIHFLYITADKEELMVHAIDASGQEFDQLRLTK